MSGFSLVLAVKTRNCVVRRFVLSSGTTPNETNDSKQVYALIAYVYRIQQLRHSEQLIVRIWRTWNAARTKWTVVGKQSKAKKESLVTGVLSSVVDSFVLCQPKPECLSNCFDCTEHCCYVMALRRCESFVFFTVVSLAKRSCRSRKTFYMTYVIMNQTVDEFIITKTIIITLHEHAWSVALSS